MALLFTHVRDLAKSKPTHFEVLSLSTDCGWSIAHEMAALGHEFDDIDILMIKDQYGRTVEDIVNMKKEYDRIIQKSKLEAPTIESSPTLIQRTFCFFTKLLRNN